MDTLYSWDAKRSGAGLSISHSCGKITGVAAIHRDPHGGVQAILPDHTKFKLDCTPELSVNAPFVSTPVSDLFFNYEPACEAYRLDEDRENRMRDAGETFVSLLRGMGVCPPTIDALWADFDGRV